MSSRLRIFGSPISTYYNKIKIALIELDLPFEEVPFMPGAGNWPESGSPSGKIPFLHTAEGNLYESQAIVEYLEDIRPQASVSLFPGNPIERARCRELIQYIELYLDAAARPVYPAAFWGAQLNQDVLAAALENLEKGLRTLGRRADLEHWLCGEHYTHADAAAWVHLHRRTTPVLGEVLDGEAKRPIWDSITARVPLFDSFQTGVQRDIPIVVLRPRRGEHS